jgi:hypothetical protein
LIKKRNENSERKKNRRGRKKEEKGRQGIVDRSI